jgi:hypothetical protein
MSPIKRKKLVEEDGVAHVGTVGTNCPALFLTMNQDKEEEYVEWRAPTLSSCRC